MLQSLNHLCGLLLVSLQYLSCVLGSLELDAAAMCGLTAAEQRRRITSLDLLVVLFLVHSRRLLATSATRRKLLAHVEFLSCYQDHSGLFHLGSPHPILVAGVIPPQVQNMAFSFVEMQEVPPAPGGPPYHRRKSGWAGRTCPSWTHANWAWSLPLWVLTACWSLLNFRSPCVAMSLVCCSTVRFERNTVSNCENFENYYTRGNGFFFFCGCCR